MAAAAGVPLSQIHYHFGSKQGMVLALFEYLNAQLLDRQNALFGDATLKLSEQWDRACDYLDDDIASGYVRVLQELIAASWADAEVAKVVRAGLMGWVDLIVGVARKAENMLGGLGPFTPEEAGAFAANAFIGAESLYLLGLEKKGSPVRQALRRVGDLIRIAEGAHRRGDVMRAKLPGEEGFVERDGVKLHYEIYGDGPETMVFIPPWAIVHSRVYKAQLPYFSERFRCITYDGRGNGKSDRPADVAAYSLDNYVADALAVMDATNAGQAIVVGLSFGGMLACVLAAHHPERVKAAILVGTVSSIGPPNYPYLANKHFVARHERFDGWNKFNREYWLTNYPDFAEHFIRNIHSEPHSTKQIEDGIDWANDTTGPVLVKTVEARTIPPHFDVSEAMYRKIRCPMLIIHGDNDQIQPYARAQAVAEVTGAELVTIPGGGHNPLGRFPAKTNALIVDFLDRRLGIAAPAGRRAGGPAESQESTLSLLPDRSRPWAPRHRHHPGVAQAASGPGGRLAGAGSGDAPAGGQRRARPSAQRAAGQRVAAHRAGVGRARSALLPGDPPHGRGADRELHDLPGCGRTGRL